MKIVEQALNKINHYPA